MTLKDYIKSQLELHKQPDLKLIYQELMNSGFSSKEIYDTINEQIQENIDKTLKDYLKNKDEDK